MGSKRINKILVFVSIILVIAFVGSFLYSNKKPDFNFLDTISSISSFFVAILTVIYVYTTSKQMDFMKQQLDQMQNEQRMREQPILDVVSKEFVIERPRFFYTPPEDRYSYLSRYFFFTRINNISNYPAVFVDVSAKLIFESKDGYKQLNATSTRINVIAANSSSDKFDIMFPCDHRSILMSALRSSSSSGLPKLEITIFFKSLSGANYKLVHMYWLDVASDDDSNSEILKNWHTKIVAAPIEEKETLEALKKTLSGKAKQEVFDMSKEQFDKKLLGDESLPISLIEIPEKFLLKTISDAEFNDEIGKHQYGRYVGNHVGECKPKIEREQQLLEAKR